MTKPLTKKEIDELTAKVAIKLAEREIYRQQRYPHVFGKETTKIRHQKTIEK